MHETLIIFSDDIEAVNDWSANGNDMFEWQMKKATDGAYDYCRSLRESEKELRLASVRQWIAESFGNITGETSFKYDKDKLTEYLHRRYRDKHRYYEHMAGLSEDEFYHYINRFKYHNDDMFLMYDVVDEEIVNPENLVLFGEKKLADTLENAQRNGWFETEYYFDILDYHT